LMGIGVALLEISPMRGDYLNTLKPLPSHSVRPLSNLLMGRKMSEPIGYFTDTRLVKCVDCGWEGRVMDCTLGYAPIAEGKRYAGEYTEENVTGKLCCPNILKNGKQCLSQNLIMLDMEFAIA
jgi:hypothetical protein